MYKKSKTKSKNLHSKYKKHSLKKSLKKSSKHSAKKIHSKKKSVKPKKIKSSRPKKKSSRHAKKSSRHTKKSSRPKKKTNKVKRKYKFSNEEVLKLNDNYLRNFKVGTTSIKNVIEEAVKYWYTQTTGKLKSNFNYMDMFYIEGSYVKYLIDRVSGKTPKKISDVDFHAEIKQGQGKILRNETENFANSLVQILEKKQITYTKKENFKYKQLIPNITIKILFSVPTDYKQIFKDPNKLEFEFTITPTITNSLEITQIPKIYYMRDMDTGRIGTYGENLQHNYGDIEVNYSQDPTEWKNWNNVKSLFLDRMQNELQGRHTLSDHVDFKIDKDLKYGTFDYKPWEQYLEFEDSLPIEEQDLGLQRNITAKAGLDMTVEDTFGKVLGTWFTKTINITPNIEYMMSAFLNLNGHIKNGIDSVVEITKSMFNYLANKNITKNELAIVIKSYVSLIIFSIIRSFGTGCRKFAKSYIIGQQTYRQPRIAVEHEYLLKHSQIRDELMGEILQLKDGLENFYKNTANIESYNNLKQNIENMREAILDKCVELKRKQIDNDPEMSKLIAEETH
jgi:hypothetical protein